MYLNQTRIHVHMRAHTLTCTCTSTRTHTHTHTQQCQSGKARGSFWMQIGVCYLARGHFSTLGRRSQWRPQLPWQRHHNDTTAQVPPALPPLHYLSPHTLLSLTQALRPYPITDGDHEGGGPLREGWAFKQPLYPHDKWHCSTPSPSPHDAGASSTAALLCLLFILALHVVFWATVFSC